MKNGLRGEIRVRENQRVMVTIIPAGLRSDFGKRVKMVGNSLNGGSEGRGSRHEYIISSNRDDELWRKSGLGRS